MNNYLNQSLGKKCYRWVQRTLCAPGVMVAGFFIIAIAMAVSMGSDLKKSWADDKRYQEIQLFAKILNMVQAYYVDPVDIKKLIHGGINGMLNELDPHTGYLLPEYFKDLESETSGEFMGLGIEITLRKEVLTVISPIEDTPAFLAGIKPGDRIVEIDSAPTKGMTLIEAAQKMKGKINTTVRLLIERDEAEKPIEVKIKRQKVRMRSIKYTDLENGYGYFRITNFSKNAANDLESLLKKHEKVSGGVKGIIIDLRHNPGGLLDQAVRVSDMFLEKGIIVSTIGRDESPKQVEHAHKEHSRIDFPIVVLVNEYSASASEIMAGALQDHRRALIVGKRTFGKGSVQAVQSLGDGSGLKLTVARYFTPSGRSIQAEGIHPDVIVENFRAEDLEKAAISYQVKREGDISNHLKRAQNEKGARNSKGKDPTPDEDTAEGGADEGEESILFWMKKTRGKDVNKMTAKEKMLSSDYQLLQAFNYLKAWEVLKK